MKNVDDVYPLSPMQEMMLLHALFRADTDVLFNQFRYEIRGNLNVPAFRDAWRQLAERHAVLRTAFLWHKLKQPLQVVRQRIELPFQYLDWWDRPAPEQQAAMADFLRTDRKRGFDPAKAPLMRLAIIRLAPETFHFVWSSHHLLMDRWCLSTLFDELSVFYLANCQGSPARLTRAAQYRDYIDWLQRQNRPQAEAFWRGLLQGFTRPTSVTSAAENAHALPPAAEPSTQQAGFSYPRSGALRSYAREHGLTLSTVLQGAWALVLNFYTGRQDLVFGSAVSGRPPDLNGVDSIIGSFINNLPVRVRLPQEQTLVEWLKHLQIAQQQRNPYEYVALTTIHELSELAPNQQLFDSLIVWLAPVKAESIGPLKVHSLPGRLTTAYPLTVSVADDEAGLTVQAHGDARVSPNFKMAQIMQRLQSTLDAILAAPHCRLAALDGFRAEPQYAAAANEDGISRLAPAGDAAAVSLAKGREAIELGMLRNLLLDEWRQLLGTEDIGLNENFFDLGGDSLMAARLHSRLQTHTRKVIPLLTLFSSPTISAMARTISEENWPFKADLAIPIRAHGSAYTLFCIASPEVNTVGYSLLSRHLDAAQPVYVLQAPPVLDEVQPMTPVELRTMASKYIEAMQSIQPAGPYHLLGMCRGAQLAVEMANQLETSGQTIAFLGILNTWSNYTISRLYHLQRVLNRCSYYAQRLRSLSQLKGRERFAVLQSVARRRFGSIGRQFAPVFGADSSRAGAAFSTVSTATHPWIEEVGWAKNDPHQLKYRGTAIVFRTRKQQWWRIRDAALGWGNQVQSVQVERLPTREHDAILREPDVQCLATKIQSYLGTPAG